ncbi:MAG: hypothetical protein BMS9Abin36_0497 [Gammaproteobacteria bacterium]|nr:MAG: hypothetical protein BMS9Abin36_0497 [Gammaproteobacteria bacterium]
MSVAERITEIFLIRPSERWLVLYFITIFLLIGCGLALGRGSADVLFFKRYGVEYLPVMFIIFGALLAVISMMYAAYADRIPSERFFQAVFAILAVSLLTSWALITFSNLEIAYPLYFLVYEVVSELLLMHALFYMSQNLETQQAKRLTPLIFAAAQFGKILGGAALMSLSSVVGVQHLLLLWVLLGLVVMVMIYIRHFRVGVSPYYSPSARGRKGLAYSLSQIGQGLKFAKRSNLVKASSLALFFMVTGYYVLCYSVNRIYTASFATEESLSEFFGLLTVLNGLAALLIQLFLTSRLLQWFGIKKINLIFPFTGIVSFLLLMGNYALPSAIFGSFNKDALMPAIRNPTRNLFFAALPDYMQGRARALSVAVVMPVALAVTGTFLYIAQRSDNPYSFLGVGLVASIVYFYFCRRMNRAYVEAILVTLKERLFLPDAKLSNIKATSNDELCQQLLRGVQHDDPELTYSHARLLVNSTGVAATEAVLKRLASADALLRDRLIKLILPFDHPQLHDYLLAEHGTGDTHHKTTMLKWLFASRAPEVTDQVEGCLASENPRLIAAGIYGVYQYDLQEMKSSADTAWCALLEGDNEGKVLAGLELLTELPGKDLLPMLSAILKSPVVRVQKAVLQLIMKLDEAAVTFDAIQELITHEDPEIRMLSIRCYERYEGKDIMPALINALSDQHPAVRRAAMKCLQALQFDAWDKLNDWLRSNTGNPRAQHSVIEALALRMPRNPLFQEIADAKVRDAESCLEALQYLHGFQEKKGAELLAIVLRERMWEYVDLALLAQAQQEQGSSINIIRAGLRSGDPRQRANAIEALQDLQHKGFSQKLARIIDLGDAPTRKSSRARFATLQAVLSWCRLQQDPWVQECAVRIK